MTSPGPKFISGTAESGLPVFTREDGTTETAAVLTFTGSVEDNGDGTITLIIPDEEA